MTTTPPPDAWRTKAHRIIAVLCQASEAKANTRPDGTRYRTHRAYRVPALAETLVQCLGQDDEEAAKAVFLHLGEMPQAYRP